VSRDARRPALRAAGHLVGSIGEAVATESRHNRTEIEIDRRDLRGRLVALVHFCAAESTSANTERSYSQARPPKAERAFDTVNGSIPEEAAKAFSSVSSASI
jgi:hypothetical protein